MPAFPGFEHLYSLGDPISNRPFRGKFMADVDCLALTRGEATSAEVVCVSWAMGGATPSDAIWTTSAHPLIVHQRVIDSLRERGTSGWRTYKVHVTDKAGETHPQYEGLSILGRCGPVDLSRSVVGLSEYPGGWFPRFLGHYFSEESWDGSDIFMETADSNGRSTAQIYVTEKTREALEAAQVENVHLQRLTEQSIMTSVYEIGGSHLLPRDFQQRVVAAYARAGVPRPRAS